MANKRGKRGKPLNKRDSSKNMRRDSEIKGTVDKEFAADSRERRDCYRSKENDWQWYAQNPQLIRDYASYPFGYPVGSRLPIRATGRDVAPNDPDSPVAVQMANASIPGFMVYYFAPMIGNPQDANAPINVAARNIYSYVRHANSGHSNYEAPDLMLYLVAMDSIYMYHSFLKRIVGLIMDYSTLNRYYPEAILQSMGLDTADLMAHIQDLRGYVNVFATKMGSMCVPNSMSYMARHVWMTEGLYTDSSASKAQTYLYVPEYYWQFTRDSTSQAGMLQPLQYVNAIEVNGVLATKKKVSDLVAFGNSIMDPILAEEDFNIMSGDILKAFGDSGVIKMMGVGEGYMVLPVYNAEVLSQMENATIYNGRVTAAIKQNTAIDSGYIYLSGAPVEHWVEAAGNSIIATSKTVSVTTGLREHINTFGMDKILNFHHDGVTPEEVMVATRLCNSGRLSPSVSTVPGSGFNGIYVPVTVTGLGSEIITNAQMYYYTWINGTTMKLQGRNLSTVWQVDTTVANDVWATLTDLERLATFDWHPAVVPAGGVIDGTTLAWTGGAWSYGYLFDVDNYTVINKENLENMTIAALLSEFSVPQMGAFNSKTM